MLTRMRFTRNFDGTVVGQLHDGTVLVVKDAKKRTDEETPQAENFSLTVETDKITRLYLSQENPHLVVISPFRAHVAASFKQEKGTCIKIWNIQAPAEKENEPPRIAPAARAVVHIDTDVDCMALSKHAGLLAFVTNGRLYVYNVCNQSAVECIASDDFAATVKSLEFHDEKHLAAGNGTQTQLYEIVR